MNDQQWVPVDQALPVDNRRVMFTWMEHGKRRTALGFYARPREIEADWGEDCSEDYCDFDEDETAWLIEGWYEDSWACGYYVSVLDVTHWRPLPPAPESQPDNSRNQ